MAGRNKLLYHPSIGVPLTWMAIAALFTRSPIVEFHSDQKPPQAWRGTLPSRFDLSGSSSARS
ncbi:hypothetical protein H257_11546 [Aphanomyces astaci]|uniref:Uncharacterized protein n=1 Tax=Aphanomyces astaci TaxID=112090 RepID=W4G4B5_APHAT|nr:hypothetical protein H257_11546 [Aphanomyces astaci]ETV73889.1 hypothetical protein H257_11546 [Aphanomyces astaci]|eukprot:XP_009836825.1 hypothetical protein H257_11546 [Aphanomyces astaci]